MKKFILFIFMLLPMQGFASVEFLKNEAEFLYKNSHQISEVITERQFIFAYIAYRSYGNKASVLLIDYDKPSLEERAYAINMDTLEIVQTSVVSHGQNTGELYAKRFSNKLDSKQTSLGVFLAHDYREKYVKNPQWLKYPKAIMLEGLSGKLNNKAQARAIVAHQAWYVKPLNGRLGRSQGCPAFPEGKEGKAMLEFVRNGGIILAYSNKLKESDIM